LQPGAIATDLGGGNVRDNQQVNQMVSSITASGSKRVKPKIFGKAVCGCCWSEDSGLDYWTSELKPSGRHVFVRLHGKATFILGLPLFFGFKHWISKRL